MTSEHLGAIIGIRSALTLNPDLAEARAQRAIKLSTGGRHEEAAAEIAIALRLDPESYDVNYHAGGDLLQPEPAARGHPLLREGPHPQRDRTRSARIADQLLHSSG